MERALLAEHPQLVAGARVVAGEQGPHGARAQAGADHEGLVVAPAGTAHGVDLLELVVEQEAPQIDVVDALVDQGPSSVGALEAPGGQAGHRGPRVDEGGDHALHPAHRARADELAGLQRQPVPPLVEPHHRAAGRHRGPVADAVGVLHGEGQGLLHEHVPPGVERGHRHVRVGRGRGQDGHGLHHRVGDQVVRVGVAARDAPAVGHPGQGGRVPVARRDHGDLGDPRQRRQVAVVGHVAAPHDADAQRARAAASGVTGSPAGARGTRGWRPGRTARSRRSRPPRGRPGRCSPTRRRGPRRRGG